MTTADLSPGRMNLALAAGPFHLLPVTDQDVNQFIFEISEQIRARYVMNGHELREGFKKTRHRNFPWRGLTFFR